MRAVVMAALAVLALGHPAFAQNDAALEIMRTIRDIGSDTPAARAGAVARIERYPGAYPPFIVFAMASAQADAGRTEQALRWAYFGEVRIRTDMRLGAWPSEEEGSEDRLESVMRVAFDFFDAEAVAAARRRALFEEAMRLEARTPRLYRPGDFPTAGAPESLQDWPSREVIARARAQAVAATRARFDENAAREAMIAEIAASIASGQAAAEATVFIPQAWRARVRPLRSTRLTGCQGPSVLYATPASAAPQAIVVGCRPRTSLTSRGNEGSYRWHSWADLSEMAQVAAPGMRGAFVVARGGSAYILPYDGMRRDSVVLIGSDGKVHELTPSRAWGIGRLASVSPSGRYALRPSGEVWDLDANRIVSQRETQQQSEPRVYETWHFVTENGRSEIEMVGTRNIVPCPGACASDLIVFNTATRQMRETRMPADLSLRLTRRYGLRQALIEALGAPAPGSREAGVQSFPDLQSWRAAKQRDVRERGAEANEAPITVAIVDLDSMQITWRGPSEQAPPPRVGFECRSWREDDFGLRPARKETSVFMAALNGEGFRLAQSPRQAPTGCAVSGDGKRLAIAAPPFLHLYEIAEAR